MNQRIGELMCIATVEVLHPLLKDIHKGRDLSCRVGKGKSTNYCKNVITYGIKMLESKKTLKSALGWTTGKELVSRKYFDKFNYKNLVIATILHEYAHFIQSIQGERKRNSVHNKAFYKILDDFYKNDYHFIVQDFLMKFDIFWNADFYDVDINKIKDIKESFIETKETMKDVKYITVNDKKYEQIYKVLKLNPSMIVTTNSNGSYIVRIPYNLVKDKMYEKPDYYIETLAGKRNKIFSKGQVNVNDQIKTVINNKIVTGKIIKLKTKYAIFRDSHTDNLYQVKYDFILNIKKAA